MPSVEPLEASFARPSALSDEQEEQFRELGAENPHDGFPGSLSRATTVHSTNGQDEIDSSVTIREMVERFKKEGIHIVEFEKGQGT